MRMKRICGVLICASLLTSSLTPSTTAYAIADEAVLESSEEASFESSFDEEEEAADEAASLESVSDEADEEKTEEITETEEEASEEATVQEPLAETENRSSEDEAKEDVSEKTVDEEGESTEASDEASSEESSEVEDADAAASIESSFAEEETAAEEEDKDLFGANIDWKSIEPNSIGFYQGGIALVNEDSLAGGRGDVYASANANRKDAVKIGTAKLNKTHGRQVEIKASEFTKGTYYLFAKYYDEDGKYLKSSPNTLVMYVEGAPEYKVKVESAYKKGDGGFVITAKPGKYDRIYYYKDGTESSNSFKDTDNDGVFEISGLSSGAYRFSLAATDSSEFAGPFYAGTELTRVIVPLKEIKYTSIEILNGDDGYDIDPKQSLFVGDMLPLCANPKPSPYVYPAIAWTSDNEKVAYVDGNNMLRAVGAGTATITVSLVDDLSVSNSFQVEVKNTSEKITYRSIKTFKLDKSKLSGKPGDTVTIKLTTDKALYDYVSKKAEKRLFKWYLVDDSNSRVKIDGAREIYSSVDENGQSYVTIDLPNHGAYSLKVETIAYISDGGFQLKWTEIPVYINGYYDGHIYKDGKRITGWANVDKAGNLLSSGKIDPKADATYYADSSCTVVTGNIKIDKTLYSFDASGKLIGTVSTGWQKDDSGEYYIDPKTGEKTVNAWIKKGKNYVHVGKDGLCDSLGQTGLFEGDEIYCVKNGVRVTGFVYMDSKGNWFVKAKDASAAYYFDPAYDGAMTTGFFSVKGKRYYANDEGVITLSDVFKAGANAYYADGQGAIQTSKAVTGKDGNCYYAGSDGKLLISGYATVNGKVCFFGTDGRMVSDQSKWTADGLVTKKGKIYFIENGKILTSVGFHEIGNTNQFIYVKDKTGALATGIFSTKINGQTRKYIFTDEGLLYTEGIAARGGIYYKNKLYPIGGEVYEPTNVKEAEEFYVVTLSQKLQDSSGVKLNSDGSHYSGMGTFNGKKCYYYLGMPMPNKILTISGKTYCFGSDGTMKTGWIRISEYDYCDFSTGETSNISSTDRNAWCYFDPKTGAAACGWKKMKAPAVDGNGNILYRTNSSGEDEIVLTGTTKNLYFSEVVGYKKIKGQLVCNKDIVIKGKQYRLGADGAPETGAVGMAYREGDNYDEFYMRSYLKKDGSFATGRTAVTTGGRTEYYFFSTTNYEVEEWVLRKTGKKWYYYGDHGRMSYYFKADCLDKNDVRAQYNSDGSIKGFVNSKSGILLKNCRITIRDSETYYLGNDGMPMTGKVTDLDRKLFYDADGKQINPYSGLKKIGNKLYYFEKGILSTTGKAHTVYDAGNEVSAADKVKIGHYLAAVSCVNESGIGMLNAIPAADGSMCAGTRTLDGRTVHTNRYGFVLEQMSPFFKVGGSWYAGDYIRKNDARYYDTSLMLNYSTLQEEALRIRWDKNYKITSITVLENGEDTGRSAAGIYMWGYSKYDNTEAYVCFKNGKIQTGNITLYKFIPDQKLYFDPDTGLSCDPTHFNYY